MSLFHRLAQSFYPDGKNVADGRLIKSMPSTLVEEIDVSQGISFFLG
jgi:hypothetical protein